MPLLSSELNLPCFVLLSASAPGLFVAGAAVSRVLEALFNALLLKHFQHVIYSGKQPLAYPTVTHLLQELSLQAASSSIPVVCC
jgi:hypothetical protein